MVVDPCGFHAFVVSSFRPLFFVVIMAGASGVDGLRIVGGRCGRDKWCMCCSWQ